MDARLSLTAEHVGRWGRLAGQGKGCEVQYVPTYLGTDQVACEGSLDFVG